MQNFIKFWLLLVLLFQTELSATAQTFSFGMFTDAHYAAIPDNGTRKYSQSTDKLAQCIDTMNRHKVSFLIQLGDFKDMPTPPDNKAALGFLQTIETTFSRFRGDRYHVLGNHDEDCISKDEFFSIARSSRIDRDKTWYSFQKGGYHFIVLDACFDSTGRSYENGNFDWSDANLPAGQLKWLEKELSHTSLPVVVFVHQLLYGNSKTTIKNAVATRAILEKGNKVKCVFHGHDHKGGYELINGIHYYTLKGMVEGDFPESNSFAIVSLSKDNILIRGYGNAVSQTLPITP